MEGLIIQRGSGGDYAEVAALHKKCIVAGFMSDLGEPFLRVLYKAMNNSAYSFYFVAKIDGKIAGFISAASDLKGFYREFLSRNFFAAGIILAPKIFKSGVLKKVMENLFYPSIEPEGPAAELMSIAVEESYRGKGLSKQLFLRLKEEFAASGIKSFRVLCGAQLSAACFFYEKSGGVFKGEAQVHKGEISKIYVFNI